MMKKSCFYVDYICQRCLAGSQAGNCRCWKCGGKVKELVVGPVLSEVKAVQLEEIFKEQAGSAWGEKEGKCIDLRK